MEGRYVGVNINTPLVFLSDDHETNDSELFASTKCVHDAIQTATESVEVPQPATTNPKAPGTAAVGSSAKYAREDHVHPAQSVPAAASVTPKAPGSAAVGSSAKYAREDHVHPKGFFFYYMNCY